MSTEMQLVAEIAKLGIGTLMALGMLGVVWYLLKVSIPAIFKNHMDVLQIIIEESKRSNDAICRRLETMEARIAQLE